MSSIFTKIINGDIPCYKVAENESHIAFLDINPIAEGHTLVVPKQEVDYFFDLPDELLNQTMLFAKRVTTGIDSALSPIRTGVIIEGLEVPHAHVHLVPIYKPSQKVALGHSVDVTQKKMQKIVESISAEVNL